MATHKVVQPPGTLRYVTDTQPGVLEFTKRHGLTNKYFKRMLVGTQDEHKHWQRLVDATWLQHIDSGKIVVVVGGAKYFLDHVAAKRDDMSFDLVSGACS